MFKNYSWRYMKKYLLISFGFIWYGYKKWNKMLLLGTLFASIIIFFYRIPSLNMYRSDKYIFSPCFGKVKNISKKNNMLQISIYIGLGDPHIQYIPYNGIVIKQIYKKGSFHPAYLFEKSKFNEKLIHNIETKKGIITVVQIGGIIARSIKSFVKKDDFVAQNQELGLIGITGSRVDIFIPLNNQFNILIKKGDKVTNKTKLIQFF